MDRLLLALRVVRVDHGRLRVPGGLATAEALARAGVHLDHGRGRRGGRSSGRRGGSGRRDGGGGATTAGQVVREGLGLVDRLLLALRVVRVDHGRLRVTGGLTAAEALAAHRDLGHLHLRVHGRGHEGRGGSETSDHERTVQHGSAKSRGEHVISAHRCVGREMSQRRLHPLLGAVPAARGHGTSARQAGG